MKASRWLAGMAALAWSGTAALAQDTYEIWHYYAAGSELAGMNALIEAGNAASPDTQFTGVIIPGNVVELRRQLQTAFLSGQPPALYQSSMAYELKTFVDGGRLHPLTDVWSRIKGDEIFPEGVQRVVKVDGVPYGVPFDLSLINNVFYNKAAFEKLGLQPPTDWDSFTAACTALREAGYQPLGNAGGPFWSLYNFYAALVSVVGEDGYYKIARGELGFDSPEFREALDLYRDRMVSCYAENWSGKTWTQTADDVINGDTAMFMMGIWVAAYFEQANFLAGEGFDMFQAPGTAGKSIFQMDVLAVPEGTEGSIAAAEQFIEAAASTEGQAAFAVPKGSLAPNVNVDPSVYGYAGSTFSRQFAEASQANAVLPNLFFLLPTSVGTELGVQIERFAIDPSDTVKEELVTTLEGLRQQALTDNAFIQW
ncbi:ABC transporter substrate-binding protein [Rubellimicrobium arenae]|uniref:ABC transporter substrate-binding protein n=1 Tax=Rubellimicrobium arenae TaxID=2817372 RepID=UPI001B31724E|nr:ABC transporter substrate-binding protein [Rubellimicrobium arenae]